MVHFENCVPDSIAAEAGAQCDVISAGETDTWPPRTDGRLLVYCHGGLWTERDKSALLAGARTLAQQLNVTVAIPNYVLCQPWPAALDSLWAILRWLLCHLDSQRVVFLGHSVGGHMSAFLPLAKGDTVLDNGLTLASLTKAVIGVQGMYDLRAWATAFPNYAPELKVTFPGGSSSFSDPTTVRPSQSTLDTLHAETHFVLVHAPGDKLVEVGQATNFARHLTDVLAFPQESVSTVVDGIAGSHDDANDGLGSPDESAAGAALLAVILEPIAAALQLPLVPA